MRWSPKDDLEAPDTAYRSSPPRPSKTGPWGGLPFIIQRAIGPSAIPTSIDPFHPSPPLNRAHQDISCLHLATPTPP